MEKFSSFLNKIDRLLNSAERTILVLLFFAMIVLSFAQVILREFFSTGLLWGDTFLRHCVLWVGFLGAAIGVSQNKHFAIDLFQKSLPKKAKFFSEIVVDLFALICLFLLSDAALKFFADDVKSNSLLFTVGSLEVPSYWMNVMIPAGFILLFIHTFLRMAQVLCRIKNPPPHHPHHGSVPNP